jgi:hypothetical protein
LPLEHPHDLLIWVTVRLDMDAGHEAPPYDHALVAGENAAADLFANLLLNQGGEPAEAHQFRHNLLPMRTVFGIVWSILFSDAGFRPDHSIRRA